MPAAPGRPSGDRPRGLGTRLPWWALALPVVSFAALLTLIAAPSPASAAGSEQSAQGLAPFLQYLAHLLGVGS